MSTKGHLTLIANGKAIEDFTGAGLAFTDFYFSAVHARVTSAEARSALLGPAACLLTSVGVFAPLLEAQVQNHVCKGSYTFEVTEEKVKTFSIDFVNGRINRIELKSYPEPEKPDNIELELVADQWEFRHPEAPVEWCCPYTSEPVANLGLR